MWIVNGQKVWTSLAQYSERCVLLTRTGPADSRHRGITAFFVDMDAPGITVAPIEMINGVREFAEVFFDDVAVPADRMLGQLNGGWAVAMGILPYERSSCFWQRIAYLYERLQRLVCAAPIDDRTADVVGDAFMQLHMARPVARTQHRLDDGAVLGAETSIDKVLVASAEQAVYDAVRRLLPETVALDDSKLATCGAASTCTPGPPPSMGAVQRFSATSSPAVSSTWSEEGWMDLAQRDLLAATVRDAARVSRPAIPTMPTIGSPRWSWSEMLPAEPDAAIAISCSTSARPLQRTAATVLDDVMLHALGVETGAERRCASCLRSVRRCSSGRRRTHRWTPRRTACHRGLRVLVVVRDDQDRGRPHRRGRHACCARHRSRRRVSIRCAWLSRAVSCHRPARAHTWHVEWRRGALRVRALAYEIAERGAERCSTLARTPRSSARAVRAAGQRDSQAVRCTNSPKRMWPWRRSTRCSGLQRRRTRE